MNNSKSFVFSKTFWLNAITVLVIILTNLMQEDFLKGYEGIFTAIIAVLNILLRSITSRPIKFLPGK